MACTSSRAQHTLSSSRAVLRYCVALRNRPPVGACFSNSCVTTSETLMRLGVQLSDPNTTAAVMQAGSRGAVSTSAGLEWSACSMCGGWNKHYVKVGCQMISIRVCLHPAQVSASRCCACCPDVRWLTALQPLVDGNDTGRRQEGFGDWYFSWPWKGGYAEYTKVGVKAALLQRHL